MEVPDSTETSNPTGKLNYSSISATKQIEQWTWSWEVFVSTATKVFFPTGDYFHLYMIRLI